MQSLSKGEQAQCTDHAETMRRKAATLEDAIRTANEAAIAHRAIIEELLADLNSVVSDADSWREGINSAQQDYFDGKSEKWQQGEKGTLYSEWLDRWGVELCAIEVEFPEEIEMPEVSHPDDLADLPDAP